MSDLKRRRPFSSVLFEDVSNLFMFFLPLAIAHNAAWALKPHLTSDPRGPWEILYHGLIDRVFRTDDFNFLFVYGNFALVFIVYWALALSYWALDVFQWPHFLYKYKIQPGKNAPPTINKMATIFISVSLNQLLNIPVSLLIVDLASKRQNGDTRTVPDVYTTFGYLLIAMLSHDFVFYHTHRALHHKKLYKTFHKQHHEYTAPMAATSAYAHPIEYVVANVISVGSGTALAGAPIPVAWLWYVWLVIQTQNDHSGYHFPLVFSPEFHDFHHLRFHTCYGWLHFWDWFYGTDGDFERSGVNKERHFRIKELRSAREIVPDRKKDA